MRRQASKVWLSAEAQDGLERFAFSRTLPARCVAQRGFAANGFLDRCGVLLL